MSDLINRSAAIDAILNCERGEEVFMLENLPSAQPGVDLFPDVSEEYRQGYRDGLHDKPESQIVQCKDCKYYSPPWYCEAWNNSPGFPAVSDEMFCSMAERRTDGV